MDLKAKYREFREWQRRPHQVAQMSEEEHVCKTCSTTYRGNYCPRCGQSYKIGRYSFKTAFLLFLDVWGLGNRGMFRSLRDLIFRPGYMIRDYLQGMQMAYFPPFKMMFLLAALSLVVSNGFNIEGRRTLLDSREGFNKAMQSESVYSLDSGDLLGDDATQEDVQKARQNQKEVNAKIQKHVNQGIDIYERYMSFITLFFLVITSGYFYLFFRKCPAIPGLRFSELVVALVFTSNMLSIYSIVCDFLCVDGLVTFLLQCTVLVALKQFSGYSLKRTVAYVFLAFLLMAITLGVVAVGVGFLIALYLQSAA